MNNIYYVYAYLRKSDNTPYYIGKAAITAPTAKITRYLFQKINPK